MTVSGEKITSRQNRLVIEVGKLTERKERMAQACFRFDGIKLFREAVANGVCIDRILVSEGRAERIFPEVERLCDAPAMAKTTVHILSDDAFSKVSQEQAPEGIVAVAHFPDFHTKGEMSRRVLGDMAKDPARRILLLESVRDPGNVGTILRSAAAFGVGCVVLSSDCADVYNPKTIRGAMGALFRMKIAVFEDITEAIALLKNEGRRVFAAALDPEALRLEKTLLSPEDCVVIGNEGHGLSFDAIRACGQSLYIPMEAGSESLNAAIAASVILWSMYSN